MRILPFKESRTATIGIELELQIINPKTCALVSRSKDLIRNIKQSDFKTWIKPEITQSMIEINSSIHHSPKEMLEELSEIQKFLIAQANAIHVAFCGGGTHPFQKWTMQKIFPTWRYKKLSKKYRYLSKRATVFGQHIHVGCSNADDALYLTHALTRYVSQFIALSASSPFYQGIDTGFFSSRSTIFNAFPLSGVMPYLTAWSEFSDYFYKMKNLKIIGSMKDFYWDIRPKPEFGTVEIRVCDTPLTIKKAVIITAYIQALSLYLLTEKPLAISPDLYFLYSYNRFQASRYGLDGEFINPYTLQECSILEDILDTIKKIQRYANQLNNMGYISLLMEDVINKTSDAGLERQLYKQFNSLPQVVAEQCKIWAKPG
ncbi:Putative glutamate--cysteine ligase 2 [Aquicella siphonis]|uniref:Putative glutamate--cysteine ligase 2 n=2 Tax=Aquicella siphonis TaxID=254247 RepID=A0A5E4PEJ0_9COXI|nr:Putative glutamate--cysteine ligase 2 [Aquicella siphonis]